MDLQHDAIRQQRSPMLSLWVAIGLAGGISMGNAALTNHSFEDGLAGWRLGSGAASFVKVSSSGGVDGGQCLVVTPDQANREVRIHAARMANPAPERPLLVEFSYRVAATCSPSDIRLTVDHYDAEGNAVTLTGNNRPPFRRDRGTYKIPNGSFIFDEAPQGDWRRRTYLVPAPIAPGHRLALTLLVQGNAGSHWIDDVVVRPAPDGFEAEPDRLLWCVPYRRGVGEGPAKQLLELQEQDSPFLATADAYHRCLSLLGRLEETWEHARRAAGYRGQPREADALRAKVDALLARVDAAYREYGKAFLGGRPEALPELGGTLATLETDLDALLVAAGPGSRGRSPSIDNVAGSSPPPGGRASSRAAVIKADGTIPHCAFTSWAKEYHIEALKPFGDIGQLLFPRVADSPQAQQARYLFHVLPFLGVTQVLKDVVRPAFYKAHKRDPRFVYTTHYTNATPRKGRVYANYANPLVRKEMVAYAEEKARGTRGRGTIFVFSWEDRGAYATVILDGQTLFALPGYDEVTQKRFRKYLVRKYETAQRMNRALGTDVADIESLRVPPIDLHKIQRPNPLHYLFTRWLHRERNTLRVAIYEALKRGNPDAAVMCDHSYWFTRHGFDPLDLFNGCDLLAMHHSINGRMVQTMLASLQRYRRKTLVCFEEHGHGDLKAVDERTKNDLKLITLGRFLNIEHKVFNLGQSYSTGPHSISYGSSYWANPTYDCSIFRYHTVGIPIGMDRVARLETALRQTLEVPIPVAMLVPETSFYWQQPHGPTQREMNETFHLLYPTGYRFGFEPEGLVLDGTADLAAYEVLLVPRAPHFPRKLWPRLEEWVQKGGTLVAIGPCGVFDEFGYAYTSEDSLTTRLEGGGALDDAALNTHWDEEIAGPWGSDALRIHTVGKGRFVAVPHSMRKTRATPALRESFLRVLQDVERPVRSPDSPVELTLRRGGDGQTGVFALNPRPGRILDGTIEVHGRFAQVTDLGVGEDCAVPARYDAAADRTSFHYTLGPGAWTLYRLH